MASVNNEQKYKISVVDVDYYKAQIECQAACPVHTDARGYVLSVASGDYQKGYVQARQPNPFASTCGQVCNAPCEKACRRGEFGNPVAIRALKRFLTEQYGVEAQAGIDGRTIGNRLLDIVAPENSHTWESFATFKQAAEDVQRKPSKVAVIGAGPAGFTACHDLSILGYKVTLYEATSFLGGMHVLGVPEYRLDRRMVAREVEDILSMGNIEVKTNMALGKDFTIKDLKAQGFDAIIIAIGLWRSRGIPIPGADTPGVLKALEEFIPQTNTQVPVKVGKKIAVIGGGNTAMDVIRTALRLGPDGVMAKGPDIDQTRRARELREKPPLLRGYAEQKDKLMGITGKGVPRVAEREVHDLVVEAWDEMLADEVEKEDALEEGVIFHNRVGPKRIVVRDGKVAGVEVARVARVYDDQNRFNPQFVPNSEHVIECDTVILAIGQMADLAWIQKEDGVEVTRRGSIVIDNATYATTAPGVYAIGDISIGPRLIIDAVADGHKVSKAVDEYIQQKRAVIVKRGFMQKIPYDKLPHYGMLNVQYERPPIVPLHSRIGVAEIEKAYTEQMARQQAERCFMCHVQTVFKGSLCIMCNGCVDICPENCLKMVSLGEIEGDAKLDEVIKNEYGHSLSEFKQQGIDIGLIAGQGSVMLKDDTACTRCALCAKRCPTEAITMEAFWFEESLEFENAKIDHASRTKEQLNAGVIR